MAWKVEFDDNITKMYSNGADGLMCATVEYNVTYVTIHIPTREPLRVEKSSMDFEQCKREWRRRRAN